jgi:hypothetical protein
MTSAKSSVRQLLRQTALHPIALDARALLVRQGRRVDGSARGLFNDVARTLGVDTVPEPVAESWRRILAAGPAVGGPAGASNGPRVLIASGYGFSNLKMAIESIFAVALQQRGATPVALLCGAALSSCEFNSLGNYHPSPVPYAPKLLRNAALSACSRCMDPLNEVFKQTRVETSVLSRFAYEDDLERLAGVADGVSYEKYRDFVYRDIAVGQHAFSSLCRATLRGTPAEDDYTRWLYRRYLITAMHVVDLAERAFAALRPDRLVAVHGVYVTHGTLCEVARKHRIPVVVFGVPYRQGTIWLSHDDSYHRTLVTEPHDAWEHTPLTAHQNEVLDAYLDSKRGGGRDYVNYHPNPIEDQRRIREELRLDPVKPIVTLYTNVLWDAQIYYDYNAFSNMLEWLYATIRHLGLREDIQLVIRVHPAEVKGGGATTHQPITAELKREFPTLPPNVCLVPPESDASSYALAEMSAATLIYGTKMGLEIAVRGIPVVVAGETFSRGKGFTHDIATREEYFELLDRVERLPRNSAEMVERARRYAYYIFFRRMMDFDLLEVSDSHTSQGLRLKFDSVSALAPEQNRTLDTICNGILQGTPFYL